MHLDAARLGCGEEKNMNRRVLLAMMAALMVLSAWLLLAPPAWLDVTP
jgi:hypothetical protein